MNNRKKLIGLIVAVSLVFAQCFTAFAAGSKSTNPISSKDASSATEVEPGQSTYLTTGSDANDKSGISVVLKIGGGGTKTSAVIDTQALLNAIKSVKSGSKINLKKMVKATQAGSKLKGWYVNGKKVNKLTPKLIAAIANGTLNLEARFQPKKIKLKLKKQTWTSVKNITGLTYESISSNGTYQQLVKDATNAAPSGKKFVGFSTTPNSSNANFSEWLATGKGSLENANKGTEKFELYPVYA